MLIHYGFLGYIFLTFYLCLFQVRVKQIQPAILWAGQKIMQIMAALRELTGRLQLQLATETVCGSSCKLKSRQTHHEKTTFVMSR